MDIAYISGLIVTFYDLHGCSFDIKLIVTRLFPISLSLILPEFFNDSLGVMTEYNKATTSIMLKLE